MYKNVRFKLNISYKGKPKENLDNEIIRECENPKNGFKWYGSGYNLLTKKRDLAFDKTVLMDA